MPAEGLSPLQRYTLDVDGYLLLERALDRRSVQRLRRAIGDQGLPRPDASLERQRFGQGGRMFTWDPAFGDLVDHPWVLAVLAEVIGPHVRLDHAYGIIMAPGTAGLGLHGPAEPFDPGQYWLSRQGELRSGLLAFAWSLTDGRPGQGGFGCIPGSHKACLARPPGAESLVVEVPQPAGSLLVFTEALAHCTLPWRGAEDRLVIMLEYSPGSSAWDPAPAAPADVVASMAERRRRFFQPPSVGGHQPVF
ncbi:MAG: phytanoyl-CoA dioxygenase family protein [Actinomycetota bacterium]|nr:phytanoyl-CoA dioxygenase family protein [Actinomycetota bacterium]